MCADMEESITEMRIDMEDEYNLLLRKYGQPSERKVKVSGNHMNRFEMSTNRPEREDYSTHEDINTADSQGDHFVQLFDPS